MTVKLDRQRRKTQCTEPNAVTLLHITTAMLEEEEVCEVALSCPLLTGRPLHVRSLSREARGEVEWIENSCRCHLSETEQCAFFMSVNEG